MQRRNFIQTAGLAYAGLNLSVATAEPRSYSFGIVPQSSPAELARDWLPLIRLLSARSGLNLQFATTPNLPAFEARLAAGEYDFVYMNPYHYIALAEKAGYVAFAHEKGRRLSGIVVVAQDAPYRQLSDLAGLEIAYPSPRSFAATMLVQAELGRLGIATVPKYVGSHESVYLNLAQGLLVAGGGIPRTLISMDAPVRQQLRLLWSTPLYTPHALAAHPRVPAAALAALHTAMLGADGDPAGQAALRGVDFFGIQAARPGDWDDVRALRLPMFAASR